MSSAKHVDGGRFHNLKKILSAWVRLNRRYCISVRPDTPWSYNERALLSIFAAAAWNAGGVALEEYSTQKGHGRSEWRGRCDIYCNIKTSDIVGESKMVWLWLGRAPEKNIDKIQETLDEACEDAEDLNRHDGKRFGICFAPVYIAEGRSNEIDERLLALQEKILSEKFDALAWCFPPKVRQLPNPNKWRDCTYCYPGLFVILRKVKAA